LTCFLLDINLLLALTDPMHIHHEFAHDWFAAEGMHDWATCPITENGFVRIASHPNYPNSPGNSTVVLAILRQLCQTPGHHFWSEEISIREALAPEVIITHAQITDVYLLGLAVHNKGKMATFDKSIPAGAVHGGPRALEIIPT